VSYLNCRGLSTSVSKTNILPRKRTTSLVFPCVPAVCYINKSSKTLYSIGRIYLSLFLGAVSPQLEGHLVRVSHGWFLSLLMFSSYCFIAMYLQETGNFFEGAKSFKLCLFIAPLCTTTCLLDSAANVRD